MTTRTVTAIQWERGWELHIDGEGVTQSHTLADAEAMARDYLAAKYDASPDAFTVTVRPQTRSG